MNTAYLLLSFIVSFGLLIIAVTVHEFAHGWVAYKLGDSTAKYAGRLTLNPLAHIDLFWTIILPITLFFFTQGRYVFGSAKPVPINYLALRNPKRDIIWIGLSGPLVNLLFAFLLSIFYKLTPQLPIISILLKNLIYINVLLGVFNLIPIPPLDGSRIVMGLLPENLSRRYAAIESYGIIIVLLLMGSIFKFIIIPIENLLLNLLNIQF